MNLVFLFLLVTAVVVGNMSKNKASKNNALTKIQFFPKERAPHAQEHRSIAYEHIEYLTPYSDMATPKLSKSPSVSRNVEELVKKLSIARTSEPDFDVPVQPIRTIRIGLHLYLGLIFAVAVLGMVSCLFLCSLIKKRMSERYRSYISCPEKMSTG